MVVTIFGACVMRIVWIYTIFAWKHTLAVLYVSYPISWVVTRGHACRLLRLFLEAYPPEARADRTRGSGYQKGVLIFLYASH